MCFSQNASFISSSILISMGFFSTYKAIKFDAKYILFASIPLLFGTQQFFEGLVWHNLLMVNHNSLYFVSLIYLFFAYLVWPIIMPISMYSIETNPKRKNILKKITFAGIALGIILYLPLLFMPTFTIINENSIKYINYSFKPLVFLYVLLYAITIISPFLLSSLKMAKYFGILLLTSLIITLFFYYSIFISVWCFFAALLSLYICYTIYKTSRLNNLPFNNAN